MRDQLFLLMEAPIGSELEKISDLHVENNFRYKKILDHLNDFKLVSTFFVACSCYSTMVGNKSVAGKNI